jgi:RNA polymerase sigma-70 factor (ECF subfamily)
MGGNPVDVEIVWAELSERMLQFIRDRVSDCWDAEDILQDVFVKLLANTSKLRDESQLEPWLYRVARNSVIDYYRKKKDLSLDVDYIEGVTPYVEEQANLNWEAAACLKTMLPELLPTYLEPLVLHYVWGYKHSEIAQRLGLTISGSKTRVQRARKQLREALGQCCDFEFDAYGNVVDYRPKVDANCLC